jgi:hypothetical protein
VPLNDGRAFHTHLVKAGLADYRTQPGCVSVQLWRRDADGWAHFLLTSIWTGMEAIKAYAGVIPDVAVIYPGDEAFDLVPDLCVTHYEVLVIERPDGS